MAFATDGIRLVNYHAHTVRCHHAQGSEEAYVRQAIASGFACLGFADHSPWPFASDYVSPIRMRVEELDGYVATVRALERKYAGQIKLYVGLECEAFPEFYPWLRQIRDEKGLDYFILGNHYDTNEAQAGRRYFGACSSPEMLYRYLETTVAGMESGLFAYLAHPDICLHGYARADAAAETVCRELCLAAKRLGLPLEYNLLGRRRHQKDWDRGCVGYTSDLFWDIAAQIGGRAIVGVDAHAPEQLACVDAYLAAARWLKARGFELIDTPDGLK